MSTSYPLPPEARRALLERVWRFLLQPPPESEPSSQDGETSSDAGDEPRAKCPCQREAAVP
jgi:hypothetical protein